MFQVDLISGASFQMQLLLHVPLLERGDFTNVGRPFLDSICNLLLVIYLFLARRQNTNYYEFSDRILIFYFSFNNG